MITVGLTGGIGSGKSTVALELGRLGVPVFKTDSEAKKLLEQSLKVKKQVRKLFGNDIYKGSHLDRKALADIVFNDRQQLSKLNNIIHPEVFIHFENWKQQQKNKIYVVKEAAILFESGGDKFCDKVILVTADYQVRLNRVLERDNTTEAKIKIRMQYQWNEEQCIPLADYVIQNTGNLEYLKHQTREVHKKLLLVAQK